MEQVFKGSERGLTKTDWLTSFHSFSFGGYFNHTRINFGALRVINDDVIEPQSGFPTHPHKNMEIITIVLDGVLTHTDSRGNAEQIRWGEIQKMSAGSGIHHSEFNESADKKVRLLQIWILPDTLDVTPSYQTISFKPEELKNSLLEICSNKQESLIPIYQDASLYLSEFDAGECYTIKAEEGRIYYLHLIEGKAETENNLLLPGDAAGFSRSTQYKIKFLSNSKFILFDLKE